MSWLVGWILSVLAWFCRLDGCKPDALGEFSVHNDIMAYHEAFWISIATAAPVIALANTVITADVISTFLGTRVSKGRFPFDARYSIFLVYTSSSLNLFIQAESMYSAFRHLIAGKDRLTFNVFDPFTVTTPSGVAIIVFIGLIFVLIVAVWDGIYKYQLHIYEEKVKGKFEQEKLAQDAITLLSELSELLKSRNSTEKIGQRPSLPRRIRPRRSGK